MHVMLLSICLKHEYFIVALESIMYIKFGSSTQPTQHIPLILKAILQMWSIATYSTRFVSCVLEASLVDAADGDYTAKEVSAKFTEHAAHYSNFETSIQSIHVNFTI